MKVNTFASILCAIAVLGLESSGEEAAPPTQGSVAEERAAAADRRLVERHVAGTEHPLTENRDTRRGASVIAHVLSVLLMNVSRVIITLDLFKTHGE